ncbi:transposable element Tcb1 transposase [Trichonephila clavipes]|nr:transposable element Tcb1 transposase [Trichonephila clavipes]
MWTVAPWFARDLISASGRGISSQTVYIHLTETSLYARRPTFFILLTAPHMKDGLLWITKHQSLTPREWSRVLFSNKSRFTRQSDHRRVFIWREKVKLAFIPPTSQKSTDSVAKNPCVRWRNVEHDNSLPLRAHIADESHEEADIHRMARRPPTRSPSLNPIKHVSNLNLKTSVSRRSLLPQELKVTLSEEWVLLP